MTMLKEFKDRILSSLSLKPRRYLDMDEIELSNEREGIHYRLAVREDIVGMLAVERSVYDGQTPWMFSHFEEEIIKNENAFFVIAESDEKVVGFIGARLVNHGRDVHISNLAVSKKFQARGIATQLIGQVVQLMSIMNKSIISLEVRRENTHAQALYRRHGFTSDKVLIQYYEGGGDAILMKKDLKHESKN